MDTVDYKTPVVQHRRPSLIKSDSVDIVDCTYKMFNQFETKKELNLFFVDKKLYRGISRATDDNVNLVSKARSEIAMDFHTNCYKQPDMQFENIDSPDYTFTLPDISIYSVDFRKFLEKDLIECSTLNSLETAQRLNWWADAGYCRKLWPLSTSGDGNCLLHAASLAMWGFHDRKLTLRTALYGVLSKGEYRDALWRRWRFQQTRLNKQAGFVYSEVEWAREWEEIVALASPEPRHSTVAKGLSRRRSVAMDRNSDSIDDTATYESLEEIHIFALSHVLRRAIIVVSDTVLRDMNGEAMAPIPFGGVYLPFEIPANDCHRAPLLLTYDMAHFSALVSMEATAGSEQIPSLIPLIDFDNVLLPIQFCIDPGEHFDWKEYDGNEGNWALSDREHIALLKEYLDVVYVSPLGTPDEEMFDDLTDEEYEKRVGDAEIALNDDVGGVPINYGTAVATANGKSKAAKQLQSVAKQFGSIGKSMSKKIKKNIGSITKIGGNGNGQIASKSSKKGSLSSGTSTQSFTRQRILCAQLKAKRYDYQEEMIRNYLECAQDRFLDAERTKLSTGGPNDFDLDLMAKPVVDDRKTCCINAGCQQYGTAVTSYMCPECFEKQKQQELNVLDTPRYGTGNSKFYTQSDMQSHQVINRLPSVRRLNELDQTLYLSNSTFYNDKRIIADPISNGTSFRHGYSPTTTDLAIRRRKSSASSASPPIGDYQQQQHDSDRIITATDFYGTPNSTALNTNGLPPPGTATVYSPGKTIIHKIIRQTVNLPPISSDQSMVNNRNAYSAPPPFPVATITESVDMVDSSRGIPTPFAQSQAKSCRTVGCMFFGSASSNFYCSKCCQQLKTANTATTVAQQTRSQSKVLTDV